MTAKQLQIGHIMIEGRSIGVAGLRDIFGQVASLGLKEDGRIRSELVRRIRAFNYIPESAEEKYSRALLRAYKIFIGHEVESGETGPSIRILGPGCPRCDRLTEEVRNALAELGVAADVDHIRDPALMAKYGFISTPALVINGRVCSSGRLPSRKKIRIWLQELH
jgi:small redox-active disulfide protein 2